VKNIFENLIEKYKLEQEKLLKISSQYTTLRTFAIILAILLFFYGIFFGGALLIAIFVGLVIKHGKIKRKIAIIGHKIFLNEKMLDRQNGTWTNFKVKEEWGRDDNHPYAKDLDIFGKNSLFQFLDETCTYYGSEALADMLSTIERDLSTITSRQQSIEELAAKIDFCQELQALGMMAGTHNNPKDLIQYLEKKEAVFAKIKYIYLLPVALWVCITSFFLWPGNGLAIGIGVLFAVQGFLFVYFLPKTAPALALLYNFNKSMGAFKAMFDITSKEIFQTPLSQKMQKQLEGSVGFAVRLSRIESFANMRNGGIIMLVLNLLFLYDLLIVLALERLKGEGEVDTWLRTLGFFEYMASAAVVPMAFPHWAKATFTDDLCITTADLGHPLLHKPKLNDYTHKNISIVTGSNMSGKTTFLRTIGINMVLANIGTRVCATSFSAPITDIYTCMRTTDSLTENISTFYAELKRIKMVITKTEMPVPMLFLIDEIFRGTNSEDRIEGAKIVLRNLNKPNVMGLITTHDLAICEIVGESSNYRNYNFKETYENNEIHFDYIIREGVSTTRNAKYLMKMVGIN